MTDAMAAPPAADGDGALRSYEELVATQAYLYGMPLVGMYELLHAQVLDAPTRTAGFNEFAHTTQLASAATNFIPAPNNDTVYSRAWLDLRGGPVLIDVPDTGDRYYTIQVLDLFSETLDNIGTRRYGNRAGTFAFVGPHETGALPDGVQVVRSRTPFALAFMRILVNGEADLPAVVALQQRYTVRASSADAAAVAQGQDVLPTCDTDTASGFFATMRQLLALLPSPAGEAAVLAGFERIGAAPGGTDQPEAVPVEVLEAGRARGDRIVEAAGRGFGASVNFWRIARTGVGTYGYDYLQRAVVWSKGALANVPEESLYPSALQDGDGQPLDGGAHRYRLHFPAGQLPPAEQFWSLTMYIYRNGFLVENPIDRYSIGDRTPNLAYGEDGSLTLYLQHDRPAPDEAPNWLPAPAEPFYVTLRLYGPTAAATTGAWAPPPIERLA